MKKRCILSLLALSCTVQGFSQSFYVRAGFGWAFAHAGQTIDGTATPFSGVSNNSSSGKTNYLSYNIDKVSFTAGPQAHVALGCMFTEHLGVDLAFAGVLSSTEYSYTLTGEELGGVPSDITVVNRAKNPLTLTPSVVLQTGGEINVYSRMGITLPVNTTIIQDQIISNQPGTGALTTSVFTLEFHNAFSLGLSGALGASYKTSNGIGIYVEAALLSLPVYTQKAEIVEFTINGISYYTPYVQANNPTTVVFSQNFNGEKGDYFDQPAYSLPFSNVGFNVGISFPFGDQNPGSKRSKKVSK